MELSIEEAISEITDNWMGIDGVQGIGQGKCRNKDCIVVFVGSKTPEIESALPPEYKGFAVRLEESGTFHAE